jgi:hypothetical protein
MVRPASIRINKYSGKFDPTVVSARFTAMKTIAVDQIQVAFGDLAGLENTVKTAISDKVANPLTMVQYLAFAREVWRLVRKHSGKTLVSEANISKAKWTSRGLDPNVLDIILNLFGISGIVYS